MRNTDKEYFSIDKVLFTFKETLNLLGLIGNQCLYQQYFRPVLLEGFLMQQ